MKFNEMVNEINEKLVDNQYIVAYAFNAIGKTRLSKEICDLHRNDDENSLIHSLCYNAFLEDDFTWNNEECIFNIRQSWITKLIQDEGLENDIIDTFTDTISKRIEPKFDLKEGKIEFIIPTGYETTENIKISKGEETIFKWVVFYVILKEAIENLSETSDNRSTNIFDELECVIIDDPVSSIDDYRIYTIAVQILNMLRNIREKNNRNELKINVSFLITTHHALFFNILYNALKRRSANHMYLLHANQDEYLIDKQGDDTVFSYHIAVIKELKYAIENNSIQKKHFNLMRSIAEKTSVFLGYKEWDKLFSKFGKYEEYKRMLNSNSHGKFSETEMKYITNEQSTLFKDGFEWFLKTYNFDIE